MPIIYMPLKNVGVHTFLSEDEVRTSVRIISGCVSETAKRMAMTAGYLTAVDGQMKLHGLTRVTKVVNSVGFNNWPLASSASYSTFSANTLGLLY